MPESLAQTGGERRHDQVGGEEHGRGQGDRSQQDPVEDDAGQAPGLTLAAVLQDAGIDRNEGRGERRAGEQLEDEVGQPHGDPEGVEFDGRAVLVGDHHGSCRAEQARAEEREADQQHGADDAGAAAEEASA